MKEPLGTDVMLLLYKSLNYNKHLLASKRTQSKQPYQLPRKLELLHGGMLVSPCPWQSGKQLGQAVHKRENHELG